MLELRIPLKAAYMLYLILYYFTERGNGYLLLYNETILVEGLASATVGIPLSQGNSTICTPGTYYHHYIILGKAKNFQDSLIFILYSFLKYHYNKCKTELIY